MRFIFLMLALLSSIQGFAYSKKKQPVLINGRPVKDGEFPQVVYILVEGSRCTATVIGPKTIITAAHCGETGNVAEFQIGQNLYKAKLTQAPLYKDTKVDHDIMLGLVDKEVSVPPMTIGGKAVKGLDITILGYGCIKEGGTGGNDGTLRIGQTQVTGFTKSDMILKEPAGAALCFGDSGGPTFTKIDGKYRQIGVNSKGNIKDTSYDTRLDIKISQDWIKEWAAKNKTDVCGITKNCESPPDPEAPDCRSQFVTLGQCLKFIP